jgi:ferric-dicitrate binding protein FerR (iron transport regulator)
MENRIWLLFTKKLTGDASAAEVAELNDLLSQQPGLYDKLRAVETAWEAADTAQSQRAQRSDFEKLLQRMESEGIDYQPSVIEAPLSPAPVFSLTAVRSWWRYAAGIAAVALLAFWLSTDGPAAGSSSDAAARSAEELNHVSTRPGSRTKLELPDGTQVWLNADSKLTYGREFGRGNREVQLVGEAFFDVAHNKKVPFFIQTANFRIKVTGTAFNVRAYPNEKMSETSLLRGKVEITMNDNPGTTYYLKPSQKLVVDNLAGSVAGTTGSATEAAASSSRPARTYSPTLMSLNLHPLDSVPVETAWVDNRLVFSDESFRDVADKMEHWYGVRIRFADKALESIRFTGRFKDETIEQALSAMQLTARFAYQIREGEVLIAKTTKP